jgi:FkbM family methyltransferase
MNRTKPNPNTNDMEILMHTLHTHIHVDFSYIQKVIQDLQHSTLPLIMLGAGDRGYTAWRFLGQNSITPVSITINKHYWQANATLKNTDIALSVFEDEIQKYEKCNVITGFSFTQIPEDSLQSYSQIEHLYYINVGVYDNYLYNPTFYNSNYDSLNWLFNRVADQESRDVLVAHLNGRIAGKHVDYPLAPRNKAQYFFEDIMDWQSHEVLVDAGAYDGDTVVELLTKMTESVTSTSVYCFEPDDVNIQKIQANTFINNHPKNQLHIVPLGVWNEQKTLKFSNVGGEQGNISDTGNISIDVDSIDNFFADNPERITIIKMDIEGSELQALIGASNRISQDKPLLAICVYHKLDDLIAIPQLIHNLVPEYRFYLRPHISTPTELVLFCKL